MGLLDGLLAGDVGTDMAAVIGTLLDEHGGVESLIKRFEDNGHGVTIRSWIGTGRNQVITPDQVHQALGPTLMRVFAARAGLSTQDPAAKLSTMLPTAINTLTPYGQLSGGPVC